VTPRIHRHVKWEIAVAVMAVFPDFQEWCRQNSTEGNTAWLIWFLFCQKDAYFNEYLAYLGWCFYFGSWVVEILLFFIRCWTRTLKTSLQLSFITKVFRSEDFIIHTCRSNRKCCYQKFDHNLDLYLTFFFFHFVDCTQPRQECSI